MAASDSPSRAQGILIRRVPAAVILPLRHAELRAGLPRASADFDGDADATTWHFGASLAVAPGEIVGCASFMLQPHRSEPAYQLRGMATRRDLVRGGIGTALLRHAIAELANATSVRLFWCNARIAATGFYERLGWRIVSDVFDVPTVGPHYVMTYRMADDREGDEWP
jgi:predicted GNAT family N-acyltransferase